MIFIHIKLLHGPRPPRSVPVTPQAFISTETCHRYFTFSLPKDFANPQPACTPEGLACYRHTVTNISCTLPCHGLYAGPLYNPASSPPIPDVEHEYDMETHTITEDTPGMEALMREYTAYKRGYKIEPIPYVAGLLNKSMEYFFLQAGKVRKSYI